MKIKNLFLGLSVFAMILICGNQLNSKNEVIESKAKLGTAISYAIVKAAGGSEENASQAASLGSTVAAAAYGAAGAEWGATFGSAGGPAGIVLGAAVGWL